MLNKLLHPGKDLKGLIDTAINAMIKPRCYLCGSASNASMVLCNHCDAGIIRNTSACTMCALPLTRLGNSNLLGTPNQPQSKPKPPPRYCGDCLKAPKPYQKSYCPLIYTHPLNYLIREFKQSGNWLLSEHLARRCLEHGSLNDQLLNNPNNIIVPIPQYHRTLIKKGFSHSHILAQTLARQYNLPIVNALTCIRAPQAQKRLSREKRIQNLSNLYHARPLVPKQSILLIDDVVTSCATVISASQALVRAGAGSISIYALARTP